MSEQEMQNDDNEPEEDTVYVYTLEDPRTGEPRYVGATLNPNQRLSMVKCQPHSKALRRWISDLEEEGEGPDMTILKETKRSRADEVEKEVIREYREEYALLNSTEPQPYPESSTRQGSASISVRPEDVNRLHERKQPGETYPDVVKRLLDKT